MTNSYSSGLVGRGEKSVGSAGTVGSGVAGRGSGTVDGCRLVGGDSHASSSVASRAARSQPSCSSLRFASSRLLASSSSEMARASAADLRFSAAASRSVSWASLRRLLRG